MTAGNFPSLTIQRSYDRQEHYVLNSPRVTIGSDPGCDISAADCGLAPRHAELLASGSDYLISDCGSPDGCFVNGNVLEHSRPLRHNDVIQLGEMILVFNAPAATAAAEKEDSSKFNAASFKKIAKTLEENIARVFKGKPDVIRKLLVCHFKSGI